MNKIFNLFLAFILISACSFNKNSKFWTKSERIATKQTSNIKLFKKEKEIDKELNTNITINFNQKPISSSLSNNLNNNYNRIKFDGNLKKISKYKFSKIENFYQYEPKILFNKENIIFFDNKGSILKFDNSSKLIWKKNHYSKSEKKLKPILFFANSRDTLIVVDTIAKLYAMNIKTGELLWSKNNSANFNSQVKVYKDKFFAIDSKNVLRCYSIKDGAEIWNIKTETSLIKSVKKLSLVIKDDVVYFSNSIGDISAVNIDDGELLWLTPTHNTKVTGQSFFTKSSVLVTNKNSIYLSNDKNEFFSLDFNTGVINWQHKINSTLTPTIVNNLIFTVTMKGFLVVIDSKDGNIIRKTDIFKQFKKKKRTEIKPIGFIMGSKNIYLTTNHGRLLVIDVNLGKTISMLKIDNEKISRPFVLNQNLYIIKENSIIKLN